MSAPVGPHTFRTLGTSGEYEVRGTGPGPWGNEKGTGEEGWILRLQTDLHVVGRTLVLPTVRGSHNQNNGPRKGILRNQEGSNETKVREGGVREVEEGNHRVLSLISVTSK